ncbi:MAG: dihydroorotate dehydrogenase (quinone), partial [Rhodobacteraceae bacterium]|nr:dihydroorotate dehydrogenase (quinone) [Paracoccaceae bacterium]
MSLGERIALRAMGLLDPETAHGVALGLLNAGLGPRRDPSRSPRLATRLAGLDLPNPLGLAAGFDKNAGAAEGLLRFGFAFVEVGTVTIRPQAGNPRPRLFRLAADQAIINRMGFNNDGAHAVGLRLAARAQHRTGHGDGPVVGVNIGKSKAVPDDDQA